MNRRISVAVSALALGALTMAGCAAEEVAPVEYGALIFDGETGVDWSQLDVDLFTESGGVYELAVGAGRLWALANPYDRDDDGEAGVQPVLLSSQDGREWVAIDLTDFEIPSHYLRDALLMGDDERVTVVFRSPVGGDDAPAVVVGSLNGDTIEWRATSPESFSPWQDTDRRGLLHFPSDPAGAAWHDDETLVMVTNAHWRPPGDPRVVGSTDQSFAIMRLGPAGGERLADSADPLGGERFHSSGNTLVPIVAFDNRLSILAGTARGGARDFVQWWSDDGGLSWQAQTVPTPTADSSNGGPWITVNHAVVTPHGILVATANGVTTREGVMWRSSDGKSWEHQSLPGVHSMERTLVTDDGYYAMSSRDIHDFSYRFWHSLDGSTWSELDATFTGGLRVTSAVGIPGGIVMSTADGLWFSGELPPLLLSE